MGQFILNGMNTAGAGAPDSLSLDKFPEGHLLAALNLRFSVPIVFTEEGEEETDAADLQDVMLMAIGSLTLKDGTGLVPYPTVPGDELRQVHRFLNLNEVPNDILGLGKSDSITTTTVHFDLRLRFGLPWLSMPYDRLPGWSQVRKWQLDIVEGSVVPENSVRGAGNILIDVDCETVESDKDQYCVPLSYFRDNQSRLYAMSPDGLVVGAWDANAAFASTALTLFSVSIGDEKVQLRKPYMVADAWSDGVLQGTTAADITDSVTMLYTPTRNVTPDRLPHGRLTFRQASQDLATIKLRGMFYPTTTQDVATQATLQAAEVHGVPIVGSVSQASTVDGAHAGAASTRPIHFHAPTEPEFTGRPGILAKPGATSVTMSVPDAYKASVKAQVGAHTGASSIKNAQVSAGRQLGNLVPGFTATNGAKPAALAGVLGF